MYVIVTDTGGDRMYLAWQPYDWNYGYFWTSKETFNECLYDKSWNTEEHRFTFESYRQAIDVIHKIDMPKSWKPHVVKL